MVLILVDQNFQSSWNQTFKMYGPPRLHPFRPSPSHHVPPGPSGTLQPSEGGFDRFQSGRSRSRVIFGEDPPLAQPDGTTRSYVNSSAHNESLQSSMMANTSPLKSSSQLNNSMSGLQARTCLPTVLSHQSMKVRSDDCLKVQGRQHSGVEDELQENMEWQRLLQEEAMQEDQNYFKDRNEAMQETGLQVNHFCERTDRGKNVKQSWEAEGQKLKINAIEQEHHLSRDDVAVRKRFLEKDLSEKEKHLRGVKLQQMEGCFTKGADTDGRGLVCEAGSDEEISWRRWIRALEEEKDRLTKLWRGGVIMDEEYMRRRRKLLDEKVEEETRSLEKLLIGGGIGIEEFQRRKGKLIVHKRWLESYQDGFPGETTHKEINTGRGIWENTRGIKNQEEVEFLRRQQENMMSTLWRDRVQMEKEFKLREKRLLEEEKNIEQARRQVEEKSASAMRENRIERQREDELSKKEKLLEEFKQERVKREKDLKIREQKLIEQKKMLESDQVRHRLEKLGKPFSSKNKTEADILLEGRKNRHFDKRTKTTNEGILIRVENKDENKDTLMSENCSQTKSATRGSSARRSRSRGGSSSRRTVPARGRSASRRRSASRGRSASRRRSASRKRPASRRRSASRKRSASRRRPCSRRKSSSVRRASSKLVTAPYGRCASPRKFSPRRSSQKTRSKERSVSRRRSASRKRRIIQQSTPGRRSAPTRRDRKRSSSRTPDNPGSRRDGSIRVTLADLPNDEVVAQELSPVRRVALLSSPARTRSRSRESMFRVPLSLRLGSKADQNSYLSARQRTPSVSRSKSRSRSFPRSRSRSNTPSKSRSTSRTPAKSRLGQRVPMRARLGLKRDVKSRLGARRRPDIGKAREKRETNRVFSTVDQVKVLSVYPVNYLFQVGEVDWAGLEKVA